MTTQGLYDIIDPRFSSKIVGNAQLDELYSGCRWAEGPVWFGDHGCLYFSDIPNERVMRYLPEDNTISLYLKPSNYANGHTRDCQGRLVSCEHGPRRVTRTELDGTITVLADQYAGKRLNSPNDVVVKSDGSIWFTDPSYGILSDYEGYRSPEEQPCRGVYRIDGQTGEVTLVAGDFIQPNGLAFSPDESLLYIAESGFGADGKAPRTLRVFDVAEGRLHNGRVFAVIEDGRPDGFRVDSDGWVWCSSEIGIEVFDPAGVRTGKIHIGQRVANLEFGGPRRNRLFITATRSLYSLYVNAGPARRP
ncbi:MAG: SMP-30/gluconolactonase/LRE family protein [Devosia sp.]|uniref:SMP-30/gluconolactonase/LRE family protein n=1 Tax=Devosia sp. TaxID=1871048 RepID=UPI0024C6659F|nr:SMP-30/gluconolactonase/LRE family protein [Devosia sp.]UYN99411.1 MAG: SMP-30/gluconolactonase/LRE family protein [Devosia sp.]